MNVYILDFKKKNLYANVISNFGFFFILVMRIGNLFISNFFKGCKCISIK
jgi:hypothetical protein